MKLLVDMNLSPVWVEVLIDAGFEAVHWSTVGAPGAPDTVLLSWSRTNHHFVLTHDLDFGALLALTEAAGPSVIQVRTQDVTPTHLAGILIATLRQHEDALQNGALIILDERRARVRVLPLRIS